jgi:signal transduction histidine kinase
MVYGFARQSGGHVRIQSEVGQGTVVTLYLPDAEGHAVPERVSGQPVVASAS